MSSWRQQALVEAPLEEVWALISDPQKGPAWSEEVLAVTGAPTKIEKGSTFEMTSRGPLRSTATTTFKVEELVDLHEIRMQCQRTGFYSHWKLTEAQGGTFTELELGVDARPGMTTRAIAALHTKSYLRRTVEKLLDELGNAVRRGIQSAA
jgi:carbon monoxide dehydrogenase subunit G